MANAGLDDDGLFSVVHAHRTGPLDLSSPKPIIVHLVTLEGVEGIALPLDSTKSHVALISLYSWTYLCLPDDVNFVDTMTTIVDEIRSGECWLRAPDHVCRQMLPADTPQPGNTIPPQIRVQNRMAEKIQDGYTLTRYLLQTGEESVAIIRGPLSPTYVPQISSDPSNAWPTQSNFSTDFQILDRQLGIMDITYSAAWQLGRTLGTADQAFCAALVRLRGSMHRTARWQAKKTTQGVSTTKTKLETFETLGDFMKLISRLGSAGPGALLSSATPKDVPPTDSQLQTDEFSDYVPGVILPFNEINIPQSSDWQTVQTWILDSLFLKNIPAQYLVSDPSVLPRESVHFFYIDPDWMGVFIDGALSIGNHLDQSDDVVRQAFKHSLNNYLRTTYQRDHLKLNYHPQIPSFGFFPRSSVVKAFPNLEVHALFPGQEGEGQTPAGEPEPTLRLERLERDVLLCLFDRMPGSKHWSPNQQITIQQPPHQQCFRLGPGGGVTTTTVEVEFGRMLTEKNDASIDLCDPVEPIVTWTKQQGPAAAPQSSPQASAVIPSLPQSIFDWDTRTIIPDSYTKACNTMLNNGMHVNGKVYFEDDTPTSAVTAAASDMKSTISPDTVDNPRKIRVPPDYTGPPVQSYSRTLAIAIAVTFQRSVIVASSSSSSSYKSSDILQLDLNPPIPESEKTHIPGNNPGKLLPNAIGAQFVCKIFPLGQSILQGRNPAQFPQYQASSEKHFPLDLIVALTPICGAGVSQDTLHNLQLYSVTVGIPLGSTANHLTAEYTGSGGKMLSNLRFNVHTTFFADKIRFMLIPRATSKLVPLRKVEDWSFIIYQVMGNDVVNTALQPSRGEVRIAVQENYRRMDDGKYFVHFARNGSVVMKVPAS